MNKKYKLTYKKYKRIERILENLARARKDWLDRELRVILPPLAYDQWEKKNPEILSYMSLNGIQWKILEETINPGRVALKLALYKGPNIHSRFEWECKYPADDIKLPYILKAVEWNLDIYKAMSLIQNKRIRDVRIGNIVEI